MPLGQGNLDNFIYSFSLLYQSTSMSQAAVISKESIIVTISYIKVTLFDLAIKYDKDNPGLSIEQTMMGLCHRYYLPSFDGSWVEDFFCNQVVFMK